MLPLRVQLVRAILQQTVQFHLGIRDLLHILDDFLIMAMTRMECQHPLDVHSYSGSTGPRVPSLGLVFAGTELDSMQIS